MQIVSVTDLPTEIVAVPQEDLASVFKVCKEMEQICNARNGIGLSAVQVGLNWKLFIVRDRKRYRHFVNCEYKPLTEKRISHVEGCLTLPRRHFLVPRWEKVLIEGLELVIKKRNLELEPFSRETSDAVWQHEIDHHNRILISDIGREVFLEPVNFLGGV